MTQCRQCLCTLTRILPVIWTLCFAQFLWLFFHFFNFRVSLHLQYFFPFLWSTVTAPRPTGTSTSASSCIHFTCLQRAVGEWVGVWASLTALLFGQQAETTCSAVPVAPRNTLQTPAALLLYSLCSMFCLWMFFCEIWRHVCLFCFALQTGILVTIVSRLQWLVIFVLG